VSLVNGPSTFRRRDHRPAQGRVLALWASFAFQTGRDLNQVNMGIPADLVNDMLAHMRSDMPMLARRRVAH
jgi:pro-apoptotic serine protease NMA111